MASHSRPIANIMCGNKKDKPKKDSSNSIVDIRLEKESISE